MPLYTLRCAGCGMEFHRFLRLGEAAEGIPCPGCGERVQPGSFKKAADSPASSQGPAPVCGLHRGT